MEVAEVQDVPRDASYGIIYIWGHELAAPYEGYIFSKWLKSLRYGNPVLMKMPSDKYYGEYHKYLETKLKKPEAVIAIAVLTEDPDNYIGFSIHRNDILDYVYVHLTCRNAGIGRRLIPPGIKRFSCITGTGMRIWQENDKYKHWKFDPHA